MESSDVSVDRNIGISKGNQNNGQLLDLVDLDGYLLSLLSTDLFDTLKYAYLVKETISKSFGTARKKETLKTNSELPNSEPSIIPLWEEAPLLFSKDDWWRWEDLLAVLTIWASGGKTSGARALGFDLCETSAQTQYRRFSFWWWIVGGTSRSSGRNRSRATLFRYKILVYAFLRIIIPRLYERIKANGLEYVNRYQQATKRIDGEVAKTETEGNQQLFSRRLQARTKMEFEEISGKETSENIEALAMKRRQLVVRTIFQWLDGAILPSIKLALLLSCWTGSDFGHGGDLSLWASGLSYRPRLSQKAVGVAKATTIPLFVLYAHRRWFQREAVEVLWNEIGRSLLVLQREIIELSSSVFSSLATEWRMTLIRWSYRLNKLSKTLLPKAILSLQGRVSIDEVENKTEECVLCGAHNVVVPYRLTECCGKLACYVCLWERLASNAALAQEEGAKVPCPLCYKDISRCDRVSSP